MLDTIETKAKDILRGLANAMKLGPGSLCPCGSGRVYADCCSKSSDKELAFTRQPFAAVLRYKRSQGGRVSTIPQSLFRQFERASLQRLPCLYPDCGCKPVSCHLIPENVLRSCFGGHCLDSRLQDASAHEMFVRTGVGQAGALPVFCSQHDNDFFKGVDQLSGDLASSQCRFLLSLKAVAFALRRVQGLLGIDFQVALFKPIETVISHLQQQYMRFVIAERLFAASIKAFEASNWDYFSYYGRAIDYHEHLFFADVINPSHDLEGHRVNTRLTPIAIVCNVFTLERKLHVLFSCPDDGSRQSYDKLFEQLDHADDRTFIAVVNNVLTFAAGKPLLPGDRVIREEDLRRFARQREKAGRCLKTASDEVFDLRDSTDAVQFVVV